MSEDRVVYPPTSLALPDTRLPSECLWARSALSVLRSRCTQYQTAEDAASAQVGFCYVLAMLAMADLEAALRRQEERVHG